MNRHNQVHPIRRAREAKGMAPEELAFKSGLSLRTIERIESGGTKPHRATLRVIAAALEAEEGDLEAAA